MQRSLSQLQAEAQRLGIRFENGTGCNKESLVSALRQHYTKPGDLPYLGKMKAYPAIDLPEAVQNELWNSPHWVAEKKENGVRLRAHILDGTLRFTTTVISVVESYNYAEVFCLPHLQVQAPNDTIIEGELVSPISTMDTGTTVAKSPLQVVTALLSMRPEESIALQERYGLLKFVAFDLLAFAGKSLLEQRQAIRSELLRSLKQTELFLITDAVANDKRAYYDRVIASGGEGIVLKNLNASYFPEARPRDAWVKVKASIEVDAFVSGIFSSDKQKVAGLEFSAYVDGQRTVIARIASLPDEMRVRIESGALNPVGLVAEVTGQEWSAKSRRLTHAKISRWREGADCKAPEECTVNVAGDE